MRAVCHSFDLVVGLLPQAFGAAVTFGVGLDGPRDPCVQIFFDHLASGVEGFLENFEYLDG